MLVGELPVMDEKPEFFMDNQSAIRLVKNPEFHKRTKHIDVNYHFIREKYEEGMFELNYVSTNEQLAIILTKAIGRDRFQRLREMLCIVTENNYAN